MLFTKIIRHSVVGMVMSAGLVGVASAASVNVSITNEQGPNGLFLTPLVSIFHNGTYDTFDENEAASTGVENVAETGDAAQAVADAQGAGATTGVIISPGGFGPKPVIDPGETASLNFDLDPNSDRYFSFLSMIIPSNDLFIGNDDQRAYEVFDAVGDIIGRTISIYTSDVWDAGTEANDNLGAAFNAAGGDATDTNEGIIRQGSLFFLDGEQTAAGTTINLERKLLATITISEVPVPAALPLLLVGLGGLGLMRRRQRG